MQLSDLNPMKNKFMWMLKIFNTFYKKQTAKETHELLEFTSNPVIKQLHNQAKITAEHMSPYLRKGTSGDNPEQVHNRYKDMILKPMNFFLSIPLIDSAYIHPFHWNIYQFGKKCRDDPAFWEYIENNVVPPEKWYYNIWENFKQDTNKKQMNGEILKGQKSASESLMVDSHNEMRVKDFIDKQNKSFKKHNHW